MRMAVVLVTVLVALNTVNQPAMAASQGASQGMPKFNIERNCKEELAVDLGIGETLASCTADEEQARDELAPQWDTFKSSDRTMCIREASIDGSPSYVELLTCLELTIPRK